MREMDHWVRAGHGFYRAIPAGPYRDLLPDHTDHVCWVVICDHGGQVAGWLIPGRTAQQTGGVVGPVSCYLGALTTDERHPLYEHLGVADGLDAAAELVGTAHQAALTAAAQAAAPPRNRGGWRSLTGRRRPR